MELNCTYDDITKYGITNDNVTKHDARDVMFWCNYVENGISFEKKVYNKQNVHTVT